MAIRNAVQERAKEQTSDTNSAKNLEIKTNEDYNGNTSYSVKSKYNEYNTIGMQWAYSSSTKIGDRNVLYKPRIKKYVLVEATKEDVGFIELKTGTYKQLREDEKLYESNKQREFADNERDIDTAIHNFESGQNHNTRSNVDVGNRGTGIQNAEVSERKSGSNKTADTQTTDGNLNVGKKYSLKWHTDLTQTQLKQVEKWLRQEGNPEETRITDTANWYKGRINGDDLFVIYSNEDANPTILYEVKGKTAKVELNALLNYLEEMEYGESIVEESKTVDAVLENDWVQEKHSLANNNDRLGERGSDTGYASVLQGESSEFIGSEAFRNVVKNLFKESEVKSYSLKDSGGNALSEEQSASNTKPTSDPDIRFSLAQPVEETKNLIAVHNLSPAKLLKTLRLGGLPMPSIAVIETQSGNNRTSKKVSLRLPSLQRQTQRSL